MANLNGDFSLSALPRTVNLIRADETMPDIPRGFPVLMLLDQSKLPGEEAYLFITDWRQAIEAIKTLKVRGAPAIGVAGTALMALRAAEYAYADASTPVDEDDFDRVFVLNSKGFDPELYRIGMEYAGEMAKASRPTAINLGTAIDSCIDLVASELERGKGAVDIADSLYEFTCSMIEADEARNRRIGEVGADLLPDGCTILTHCNAGSLATAFYGTALGVVYSAAERGRLRRVYADETRPVCQGSRLTAWELSRASVPVTLICDDMAASVMAAGKIDAVVVGADRIAVNGDVANKIGTLGVAILAAHFGIPFYVAAPLETLDVACETGADIPIEQRSALEVLHSPISGVDVENPAFDITPASLVTAIITEVGAFAPQSLKDAIIDA